MAIKKGWGSNKPGARVQRSKVQRLKDLKRRSGVRRNL
jgi:hypothetical protein